MFDFHGYGPSIMKGALLTIEVGFLALLLSLLLGLIGASAKLSNSKTAKGIATFYTTTIRGVPDLVLMLLIFYGGQVLINSALDWINYDLPEILLKNFDLEVAIELPWINIDQFVAGVGSIGFIFGAYMTETFRGAFMAVDRGQIEAGYAYGMTKWKVFSRIMFPQMMRHALPGLGNNWLVLLKTTALVSIIGLADMVRLASEASKAVHQPFKFFIPVVIVYLLLTSISEWVIKLLERRYSAGVVKG
ncbi:ABC transporter [Hahella sp. CCB-MM4]|uniref:ABC transporter permease n=1 Tax=Hahella sp. (strain CCB-MM4) TaxID=1926491 RepID=UPI000B9B06E9|nr:ABC transporter permease [Hahella sp. CCB-MM4]OZG73050.1 ABC transporter [Hahella sp. CCB-MM4]